MPQFQRRPLAAVMAMLFAAPGLSAAQSAPGVTAAAPAERTLPEVKVEAPEERADGPVDGYRPTRSGTFTKTDTPLKEVPASVSVVPGQVMKDTSMQSMS